MSKKNAFSRQSFFALQIHKRCHSFVAVYDRVGIGRYARHRIGKRPGIDEGHAVCLDFLGKVRMTEKDERTPQFLGAERKIEQVAFHAVEMSVREKNPHVFDVEHALFGSRVRVAVALDEKEIVKVGNFAQAAEPVSEEKDVITLPRHGNQPLGERRAV